MGKKMYLRLVDLMLGVCVFEHLSIFPYVRQLLILSRLLCWWVWQDIVELLSCAVRWTCGTCIWRVGLDCVGF